MLVELVLQEKFPVLSRKTVTEKNLQPGDILRGRLRLRLRRKPVDEIPPPFLRDMINFFLSSVVRRLRLISDAALLRELLQFRINLAVLGRPELTQSRFKLLHQIIPGHFLLIQKSKNCIF